jgi:RNA polymerase sigma factor (sigma-70 family)
MRPFDDRMKTLTTTSGVKVTVGEDPFPAPRRRREPPEPSPQVIVLPAGQPAHERGAFLEALCKEHGAFVERVLILQGILPESAKDLRQCVLLILCAHVDNEEPLENVRAFLKRVAQNEAWNHKRRRRPQGGADEDAAICEAPDPEQQAEDAELRGKLLRYLALLPEAEQELVRRVDFEGTPIEQIVAEGGRPRTSVVRELNRARDKLADLARASRRACGARLHTEPGSLPNRSPS